MYRGAVTLPKVLIGDTFEGVDADQVFARLADFEGYPAITDAVRNVQTWRDGAKSLSRWEVVFRNGLLRWVEEDTIDAVARRAEFHQTEGDLAHFTGAWTVTPNRAGAHISFEAEFDLGMPSLADMLNPVAERALRENVVELMSAFARAARPLADRV
jgi:ribosome-associated toxin RatA of RatAB toxin-antitoxin module